MSDQTVRRRIGVILRDIPVRVIDASANGCLIECREPLPEGAVGLLEISGEDGPTVEPLRIRRSTEIAGGATRFRAGAQFLPLGAPGPRSVRNQLARLEVVLEIEAAAGIRTSSGRSKFAAGDAGSGSAAPKTPDQELTEDW
jgi:PilZ domain-containing protein